KKKTLLFPNCTRPSGDSPFPLHCLKFDRFYCFLSLSISPSLSRVVSDCNSVEHECLVSCYFFNMVIESQVSSTNEAQLHPDNISVQDGDPILPSFTPDDAPQQPTKKPTRQWAAWTRQEEECFFTALRQVGKNFDKITRRVQSKNKDQVRHYYYRLVRRMNKLLGPELCLDAKNSKDTNAAMLRWWSLLEKYSCKASKLHLKPRRFKIFVETLEHQLLKDRKKNVRKRPSQRENCSPTAASTVSNQSKASGPDTRTFKLVLVDSQNIQKLGSGKGSLKRNFNIGVNRSNSKGDSTTMKAARQQRKPGLASSAAYKKWEKAAIAGVSLVADAAEHLERTAIGKEVENDPGERVDDSVEKKLPPLPIFSHNLLAESYVQASMKLKLQLFPIDEGTRRALEMDNHNPHLELTLSTRKKISSVLEHLNRKWGHSSVASGELMLFPYNVQRENLVNCQRWTQDSIVSAADVHAIIGSPTLFRLRYGWLSDPQLGSVTSQTPLGCLPGVGRMDLENMKGPITDSVPTTVPSTNEQSEKLVVSCKDQLTSVNDNNALACTSSAEPNQMASVGSKNDVANSSDISANISCNRKESCNGTITRQFEDADDLRSSNCIALSACEWADSLTNISVGDLLSEVPQDMDANCIESPFVESSQCLQQIPFSCDSFDAAIAAHISRHQNKSGLQSTLASHSSSIWDAEETCDAFSFQQNHVLHQQASNSSSVASLGTCTQVARTSSVGSGGFLEELPEIEEPNEDPMDECPIDPHMLNNSAKDFDGLTDVYWPDFLGPLDLDTPSSKYHSEDLILSDSLGGLSRLIASSLDAFQNCSFFGFDKKEGTSTFESQETALFSDLKNGTDV
ncbi:Myb_DNA-binding domain-containing protein, partial [Cephalotus follicularis]